MIICHCKAVRDSAIREAIRNGACSRKQIARACGAGAQCGGCRDAIVDILEDERDQARERRKSLPLIATAAIKL